MFYAALTFSILGILAFLLGLNGIGGLTVDIGKVLLLIFIIFASISLVANIIFGKKVMK